MHISSPCNYHDMSDGPYSHHGQQWSQPAPHLMPPSHNHSAFPSPSSPSSSLSEHGYTYYPHHDPHVDRSSSALSLNLSSLSVTSPTNLSPSHVSPITPISPDNGPHAVPQSFQFVPAEPPVRYDEPPYDYHRRLTSSRSSSSSEKSVPRKRSFTAGPTLAPSLEESSFDTSYDDVDIQYAALDPDDSTSGGEQDDQLKPMEGQLATGAASVLGKPLGTNNFVTKLYQMINDPKSAQFITWTELGTSFVVSNVGEFSRTILGSHFKHNNFSSFVRQLNMYGFHKINRTPRAQRTSADVQTWEFSHHKFLRARPDLLEEIKRKALEPDPSLKHRIELPGEVAAQLSQMRDDNRRLAHALHSEKAKVDRLAQVTKAMHDVMAKAFPGGVPPFPIDVLDSSESPNIYITSPTNPAPSHYSSLSALTTSSLHSLHSLSPSSSPTTADFPSHSHSPHALSRQHSYQHVPYDTQPMHGHGHPLGHLPSARYEHAINTPLPPSPVPLDPFGDDPHGRPGNTKRQRTNAPPAAQSSGASASAGDPGVSKRLSRARSDSAPLGYGINSTWPQTRPRSGSGLGPRGGRRDELPVPNIGTLSRGHTLPMLSIPSTKQTLNQ